MTKNSNKFTFHNIIKYLFFVGTFVVSFLTLFVIVMSTIKANNFKSAIIFSHPSITNILILIVFFINITQYKDNKIYYWLAFTALISSCITLIFSSSEMASNIDLLLNKENLFNFFFRLHQIILPSLYLIFYIFLDNSNMFKKKRSLLISFLYPLIYIVIVQFLSTIQQNENDSAISELNLNSFYTLQGLIFNILKIFFLFLPLTPTILGLSFLKEEIMKNQKIKMLFLSLGIFLIFFPLSGLWYAPVLNEKTFKEITDTGFANQVSYRYKFKQTSSTTDKLLKNNLTLSSDKFVPLDKIQKNFQTNSAASANSNNFVPSTALVPTQNTTPPTSVLKERRNNFFRILVDYEPISNDELVFIQQNWNEILKQGTYTFNETKYKISYKSSNNSYLRKHQR
ncbi:hypothetical protein ['Camptotheca acuminata' phytoplasma]|uniref:hypothetical protein n=1 Tax='Camptotheca acuminata' phytoplasma TaxID=3239192 RepID=UPI00351A3686